MSMIHKTRRKKEFVCFAAGNAETKLLKKLSWKYVTVKMKITFAFCVFPTGLIKCSKKGLALVPFLMMEIINKYPFKRKLNANYASIPILNTFVLSIKISLDISRSLQGTKQVN